MQLTPTYHRICSAYNTSTHQTHAPVYRDGANNKNEFSVNDSMFHFKIIFKLLLNFICMQFYNRPRYRSNSTRKCLIVILVSCARVAGRLHLNGQMCSNIL
jgi:hypothetical protein